MGYQIVCTLDFEGVSRISKQTIIFSHSNTPNAASSKMFKRNIYNREKSNEAKRNQIIKKPFTLESHTNWKKEGHGPEAGRLLTKIFLRPWILQTKKCSSPDKKCSPRKEDFFPRDARATHDFTRHAWPHDVTWKPKNHEMPSQLMSKIAKKRTHFRDFRSKMTSFSRFF